MSVLICLPREGDPYFIPVTYNGTRVEIGRCSDADDVTVTPTDDEIRAAEAIAWGRIRATCPPPTLAPAEIAGAVESP